MSTRCQVEVTSSGLSWNELVTLYHHSDGYPTNMLKVIYKAYKLAIKPIRYGTFVAENKWQAGRPGKSAAFLCAADPSGFDVESSNDLHSDIEWFYSIECVNKSGGSMAESPVWIVSVYVIGPNWSWDKPDKKDLKLVARNEISVLVKRAKEIQEKA